ncbi:MAG: NADH-quinone oxidoreductase subunit J [Steroidobacteraceae bacterium]
MTPNLPMQLFFALAALGGGVAMLFARHPMRVAIALIGCMLSLAGLYATLGVHVIAVFQVLIYVGAVMVFMVYVIMLLDVRDPSFLQRYGRWLMGGLLVATVLAALLAAAAGSGGQAVAIAGPGSPDFAVKAFSGAFLREYWLHFELTSVLLLAAVVAAITVIKGGRRHDG